MRENTCGRGSHAFPRVGRVEAVVTEERGNMCTVKDVTTGKMLKVSEELVDPYVYGYSTNTVISHTERRGGCSKRLREDNKDLKKQNKKLKIEKAELRNELKELKTKLKKIENELSSFDVYNLFPPLRNTKRLNLLSQRGTKVRDHVMVLLQIKDDEIKKMVRKHEDLAVKHEKSVEELKGAKDVICKHEEESKLLRSLLERRVSSRDQHRKNEVKNDREALLRRLQKAERQCRGLQAKVVALRDCLDDALLDVETKVEQSCCAKEDTALARITYLLV